MTSRTLLVGLLLGALTSLGCGSTGVVQIGREHHAAKPAKCRLDVYASREDVERQFEAVCLISSESGSTLFNDRRSSSQMNLVKKKACGCGADAIVVRDMSRTATKLGQGYSQAKVSIEAIVYQDAQ